MKRTWLWTPALLIALAAVSYGVFRAMQPEMLPPGLLYGNGHIEGTEVRIAAEVSGRILESRMVEGTVVARGDRLVRIDDQDLRIRRAQASAEQIALERERARIDDELRTQRHHVETTQADLRRYRELLERGTASAQRQEQAENAFQEARGRLASLEGRRAETEARLEAARQSVRFLDSQLGKAELLAPIDGTILVKAAQAGEFVSPGQTVAVLVDLTQIELKLFIPEKDLGKVKLGDPARVRVDAFPDRMVDAKVIRVDQRAQFTPRDIHMPEERVRMVFGVTLLVANPRGELKPGMPADAWIRWQDDAPWPTRLVAVR